MHKFKYLSHIITVDHHPNHQAGPAYGLDGYIVLCDTLERVPDYVRDACIFMARHNAIVMEYAFNLRARDRLTDCVVVEIRRFTE